MKKKEKHLFVEDDLLAKKRINMKQEILNWWMELTDKERFRIIEEAYENW